MSTFDLAPFLPDPAVLATEAAACVTHADIVIRDGPGPGSLSLGGGLNYRVAQADVVRQYAPHAAFLAEHTVPAIMRTRSGVWLTLADGPRALNCNQLMDGQDMEWHIDGHDLACTVSIAVARCCIVIHDGVKARPIELEAGEAVAIPSGMAHYVPPHQDIRRTFVAAYVETEAPTGTPDGLTGYLYEQ